MGGIMSRYKVEISNVNTANIKVLKQKEMEELLINGNLKLVLSILKKYNHYIDNMDDLFQVGCIGLIKAIDNFDLSHQVKFSTYAVPMILGEIKRYLRDNTSLRISRSVKDLNLQILKKKEELTLKLNREPTDLELANSLGIKEYELSNAINASKDIISMFEPIYNDGSDTIYLCDQLEDKKNNLYDIETKISVSDALKRIREKERYILIQRYLVGKTISRLEKNGIDSIKKLIL